MFKLGITGGIGAGKSMVCKIFSKWGIPVYIADEEAKRLMDTDSKILKQIKNVFGAEIFTENGKVDRVKMASVIFKDTKAIKQINEIIHPQVRKHFLHWTNQQNGEMVVCEAAIMFESGMYRIFDKTLMVYTQREKRIERIVKRNGFSREKIETIMNNQMSDEEKCKKADFVLHNNEKTLLLPQLLNIYNNRNRSINGKIR